MTKVYCSGCGSNLQREYPDFHSKADGWIKENWFPHKDWKCLSCPSCNNFIESKTKSWQELEKQIIAEDNAAYTEPDWLNE